MLASGLSARGWVNVHSFQDGGEERWESLLKSGTHMRGSSCLERVLGHVAQERPGPASGMGLRHPCTSSSSPILHDRFSWPHFTEEKNKALVEKAARRKEQPEDRSPRPHSGSSLGSKL